MYLLAREGSHTMSVWALIGAWAAADALLLGFLTRSARRRF
jgi:hypothetical protein